MNYIVDWGKEASCCRCHVSIFKICSCMSWKPGSAVRLKVASDEGISYFLFSVTFPYYMLNLVLRDLETTVEPCSPMRTIWLPFWIIFFEMLFCLLKSYFSRMVRGIGIFQFSEKMNSEISPLRWFETSHRGK